MSDKPISFWAGWWKESLHRRARLRHHTVATLSTSLGLIGGSMGLSACHEYGDLDGATQLSQRPDSLQLNVDTLELQRRHGWAVGLTGEAELELIGSTSVDVFGGTRWRDLLEALTPALAPGQGTHMPYYVPTLFQSLVGPSAEDLRALIRPIFTEEMSIAAAKGRAILSLFDQVDSPLDTALIVDLPGPESIALASALAERFDPIFAFGNWPHPVGVVPAHETLAAALYYAPLFEMQRAKRPQSAPAMLVLDANRLNDYTDANEQFDNRYLASVPSVEGLRRLGIKHILYVTKDGAHPEELDDLNEAFVEIAQAGIDIRSLGISEIERSEEPPPEVEEEPAEPIVWALALGSYWYYGGSPRRHCGFWHAYGWHTPRARFRVGPPAVALGMRTPRSVMYHPHARATMFAGGQLRTSGATSAYRPSGFGSVAVHASRSSGHLMGVGRSGSFGRSSGGIGG